MIIDEIKTYFEKECELFKGKRLNVNCLGEKEHSCVIEVTPCKPVIDRYADGGTKRQICFAIATREYFDNDEMQNLTTAQFYEAFEKWIDRQNENGTLPELSNGYDSLELEIMNRGFVQDVTGAKARYQINLRLIYEKY